MSDTSLQQRLRAAMGRRTNREIGEMTGTHPETVRRYLHGHPPRVEFLAAFCEGLQINGDWLLTGRGRMHRTEIRPRPDRNSTADAQLEAAFTAIERIIPRIERLEVALHRLEGRAEPRPRTNGVPSSHGPSPVVVVPHRARPLAKSLSGRRRADAD
ncbi:hypothetical protein PHYC_00473 [Phycisphaerales bacterium]|nr:hypothetical protein PHYC_00473 [Phycisphaerales bacterium]